MEEKKKKDKDKRYSRCCILLVILGFGFLLLGFVVVLTNYSLVNVVQQQNQTQFVSSSACCSTTGTSGTPVALAVGAGNYCSLLGKIVWASSRDGSWDIHIMNDDGRNPVQLTYDAWAVINQHPVFTPHCREIVWSRNATIWIMNLTGGDQTQLTFGPSEDNHPWVSGDGRIYFNRETGPGDMHVIYRMSLDGTNAVQITGTDVSRFHPSVRYDNNLIAYTADINSNHTGDYIGIWNQATGTDTVLYRPGWPVSGATWHPDGTKLVLAEDDDWDGKYRIVVIGYPSGVVIQNLTDDRYDDLTPYYTYPSGYRIDFVRNLGPPYNREIFRMNADGSGQIDLTNHTAEDTKVVTDHVKDVITSWDTDKWDDPPEGCPCNPNPPPKLPPPQEEYQ